MNTDTERVNAITEKVIGCAFHVANTLGCGFLEKPYENAMAHSLRKIGFKVRQQTPISVWFDGLVVGEYVGDLLVEDEVLVELKAVKGLDAIHEAQCINYLKASRLPICLVINFGRPKLEIKRFAGHASG